MFLPFPMQSFSHHSLSSLLKQIIQLNDYLSSSRMSSPLTLLTPSTRTWLMLISLKFIISDRLPKISYLTTLDKYLHSSYLVMIILIINVCAIQLKTSSPLLNSCAFFNPVDEWILGWILFAGWTLVNLFVLRPTLYSIIK